MRKSCGRDPAGSAIAAVLVGLVAIGLLAVAGFQSASFGRAASRAAVAAGAALHAADSGFDLYAEGIGPTLGTQAILAPPGLGTVVAERLVRLNDSTIVVLVRSDGMSPPSGAAVGRRSLTRLFRVDASSRTVVRGTWRERM